MKVGSSFKKYDIMKKLYNILTFLILSAVVCTSCTPDNYDLGKIDVKSEDLVEGIAYTITHDTENPNIVYLTSLMDSKYTPLWNHPQGRSQEDVVTLKVPFAGEYDVQFGVQTRGGYVYGDSVVFNVENMYSGFIEDELWTFISGGPGNSKTWYFDLDADGLSRYFDGPISFYGIEDSWESAALYASGKSMDEVKEILGLTDSWVWNPDYAGNSWLMDAGDYGSMTFELTDGANVSVEHGMLGIEQSGTYLLDTDNHTMKMVDAGILHDSDRDGHVIDWGNLKIISLTEDYMQLGALRDAALSGDGASLLVYNFISKDYYDNWVPEEE